MEIYFTKIKKVGKLSEVRLVRHLQAGRPETITTPFCNFNQKVALFMKR